MYFNPELKPFECSVMKRLPLIFTFLRELHFIMSANPKLDSLFIRHSEKSIDFKLLALNSNFAA